MSGREYKDGWLNPREIEYIDKIDYFINNLRVINLNCLKRVYEGSYDFAYYRGKAQTNTLMEIQNDVYFLSLYIRALRDILENG